MRLSLVVLLCFGVSHIRAGTYTDRFLQQYNKIHNSSNGYFSKEGIPYHSVETLMCEAPDHGHETTSEAYSYYIWLEAMKGAISGDFGSFNKAWQVMEDYMIPSHAEQPTNNFYQANHPATFAAELDRPEDYPSPMEQGVPVGQDPLFQVIKLSQFDPITIPNAFTRNCPMLTALQTSMACIGFKMSTMSTASATLRATARAVRALRGRR